MEQVTRIGLVTKPWQGLVLPLNYTCDCKLYYNTKIFIVCQENINKKFNLVS